MPRDTRLTNQDGFIREVVWIVVALVIVGVIVLDAMSIFNAHQAAKDASEAARSAKTEYAQSLDVTAAKLAAMRRLAKSRVEMVDFKTSQGESGAVRFTVSAQATADTYAFHHLARISALSDWVERMTHPQATGSAE